MKKTFWVVTILFLVILLVVVIYLRVNRVNIGDVKEAEICFANGNYNILNHLGDKEVEFIKTMFNGKIMYKDKPSCGFSENISIKFDDEQTFCIAMDTCPIVYWKEKDSYIKLTEDEKAQLYSLLETYGFFFPCL